MEQTLENQNPEYNKTVNTEWSYASPPYR
jgi:hypothetical protein